jgi:hypothetical protein
MFADQDHPLRISSLNYLTRCEMRALLLNDGILTDESGPAAQTGSLCHLIVSHLHRQKNEHGIWDIDAAIAAVGDWRLRFPLADGETALQHAKGYAQDPRNQEAQIILNETRVELALPPHPSDPTGLPVFMRGILDQVRLIDGHPRVCDVKTGAKAGAQMLDEYATQVAGYSLAATVLLDEPCPPGALIRTASYLVKGVDPSSQPDGVFWWYSWGLEEAQWLIDKVVAVVARVRAGEVYFGPSDQCAWCCPAGGFQHCSQLARQILAGHATSLLD